MRQKKSIQAKIVKHAHRRRFQEYIRTKGRDKATIAYVYWSMFLRSGKDNVFELEEGLFLADLGIGKNALRPARKTLFKDGWLSKAAQKIDPLTKKWGTRAWTVNAEPVAQSEDVGAAAPVAGDRSPDGGSAGDRSVGDTVVLHPLDVADAPSTSPVALTGGTSSGESVSPSVSLGTGVPDSESQKQENPTAVSSALAEEQNQPQKPDQDFITFDLEQLRDSGYTFSPEVLAIRDGLGSYPELASLLGLPYLFEAHNPDLSIIATVLKARNRSVVWLVQLLRWVKKAEGREAKFWSSRIHTGTRGLRQFAKHVATGELCQQYDAYLTAKDKEGNPFRPIPGGNPLLNRDYVAERIALNPELRPQRTEAVGGNAWDGYAEELRDNGYTLDELRPKAKTAAAVEEA